MEKWEIALGSTLAALYIVLVIGLAPISFLQVQFRAANVLRGMPLLS